jgi:hypothetical protein
VLVLTTPRGDIDCKETDFVRLAGKKEGSIPDAKGAFLLLALLVNLGDCPGLNIVGIRLCGLHPILWVNIGTGRRRRLRI